VLKVQNRRLALIVFASILIHVALFTALYLSNKKNTKKAEIAPPSIIQAELIFVDIQVSDNNVEKQSENPPIEVEVPLQNTDEITENVLNNDPIPRLNTLPESEPENVEDETSILERSERPQITENLASDNQDDIYQLPVQDVAKSQLHSYQQSKLESLAAQAASEYREQQNHPQLNTSNFESFMTEDEKIAQKATTTVDCSSATNQTMSIVMGLMGGRVRCSEPPPFDSFIQKRLNKTAELPAMQNQDNKQR
jgi:hypothetical protein